jgi:hypothetical protein
MTENKIAGFLFLIDILIKHIKSGIGWSSSRDTAEKIQLMGDIDEGTLLDLVVAFPGPRGKELGVQIWVSIEGDMYCVNNMMEKVGLVFRVAIGSRKDHPIGTAGVEQLDTTRSYGGKEVTSGAAIARGFSRNHSVVHGLVVERGYLCVENWINLGLENRVPVKVNGEVKEPARSKEGEKNGEGRGDIYQVQECVGDQEIPGSLTPFPWGKIGDFDGLKFHKDILISLLERHLFGAL